MTRTIYTFFTCLCFFCIFAQQTGSFNVNVSFNGQLRTLSLLVPNDYNSDSSYKLMICLHGLGDNSTNYRNALSGLGWGTMFPNTVVVCPDGGGADFYAQLGRELIIDEAMAFAMQNYNIDTNYVLLQGFSLGGRSALKYGLDFPETFKGLLLNTPAIQGANDAFNDSLAGPIYKYENADQIPIFITVGQTDQVYDLTLKEATIPILKKNNAILHFSSIPNMGHTIQGGVNSITAQAYSFFESPLSASFDIDLFDMSFPLRVCDNNIEGSCFIQNKGDSTIHSVEILYDINGVSGSYVWTGNLGFYEHAEVVLPVILSSGDGKQTLSLEIGDINGGETDTITVDNSQEQLIQIELYGESLPVFQGFEQGLGNWVNYQGPSLFYWFRDGTVSKTGNYAMTAFNTILIFYTAGNRERFESPVLNFSNANNPILKFDVAFNYHHYTANVLGIDSSFTDTLEVMVSIDCGQTFQSVYKKGGSELATATGPILNPLDINSTFFFPSSNEWREEKINLSSFANEEEVIIRFDYISALGGNVIIDDILIDNNLSIDEEKETSPLSIYPNPASEIVNIQFDFNGETSIVLMNANGKIIRAHHDKNLQTHAYVLDVSDFPNGSYILQVESSNTVLRKKLLIVR